jgi:hypothetical protein
MTQPLPLPNDIASRIVHDLGQYVIRDTYAKSDTHIYFFAIDCVEGLQHCYLITSNGMHKRMKRDHSKGIKGLACKICNPQHESHRLRPPSEHEIKLYDLLKHREEYRSAGLYIACAESKVLKGKFGAVDVWLVSGTLVNGRRPMLELHVDGEGHTGRVETRNEGLYDQVCRDELHNYEAICNQGIAVVRLHYRDSVDCWHVTIQKAWQVQQQEGAQPLVTFSPAFNRSELDAAAYAAISEDKASLVQHCWELVQQYLA